MSIVILLSPNLKPLYSHSRGDNNYLPFQVSTNNFKIDINGMPGRLEMSKNDISA